MNIDTMIAELKKDERDLPYNAVPMYWKRCAGEACRTSLPRCSPRRKCFVCKNKTKERRHAQRS